MNKNFDDNTEEQIKSLLQFEEYLSPSADKKLYEDRYITKEQNDRDKEVTKLLQAYVKTYENKVKVSRKYQKIILYPCIGIISIFAVMLLWFSGCTVTQKTGLEITDLAAFITACISFISLIIGLLTIITKYFFPENGEQYITQIVETIQKNDLENKRENAKNIKNQEFQIIE